jgi:DHA2 family multidrug resistance protein-like MFS transporter
LALTAIGLAILAQIDSTSGLQLPVLGSVVFSLGLGPVFIVTTDLIVGTAPAEKAGAASAISETGAEFGGALGIAILGSVGTAIYRGRVFDSVPEGLPSAARDAARDTLGGALGVAQELPARLGDGLVDAAREAFAAGLRLSLSISALIAVFVAVMVATKLRGVPPAAHNDAETPAAHPERALEPATAEA